MFKFRMWPVLATGFLLLSVGSYAIADNEYGYKFGPIADNEDGHKFGSILCRVGHGSMVLFASRNRASSSSSVGRALSSVISRSIHDATPRSAHAHDQD